MEARHQERWVFALQAWREELIGNVSNAGLNEHAKRTAGALGGMESIGEIALADRDERLIDCSKSSLRSARK